MKGIVRSFTTLIHKVEKEKLLFQRLNQISEPLTSKKIADLGLLYGSFISEKGNVVLKFNFNVPGYPHREKILSECRKALSEFSWVKDISFETVENPPVNSNGGVSKVKHIIGVSSCKGGVGKSTIAVNLAASLALKGLNIGLMDADIYGPSVPLLLAATDPIVRRSSTNPNFICPLIAESISRLNFISFGNVNPNAGAPGAGGKSAALMRGPMASKVLNQLLFCTEWGELDYLIIDMPPGTGDIQLTLCQNSTLSGAIVVTTPHALALADVAKGIDMFASLSIPMVGLVENMSYFKCEHGSEYYPFGKGGKDRISKYLQENSSSFEDAPYVRLPLFMDLSDDANSRVPLVIRHPESEVARNMKQLCDEMIAALFLQSISVAQIPSIQLDSTKNALRIRYFREQRADEFYVHSDTLRQFVGLEVNNNSINQVVMKGKFGVSVIWSDYSSIFSFDMLDSIIRKP